MGVESVFVKDYESAKEYLHTHRFKSVGYVKEKPLNEFFIEEYKHEDGRLARTLDLTFLPHLLDIKNNNTYLIQIKNGNNS